MKCETIQLETLRDSLTLTLTSNHRGSRQKVWSGAQQMAYDKPQVAILGDAVTLVQAVKVRRIDPQGEVAGAMP